MHVFQIQGLIMSVVTLAMFGAQAWAFLDAVSRRPDAFVAADKMTKGAWTIILGVALVAHMIFWNPASILNLIGIVAALVYLADVRPALRALTGR